MNISKFKKRRDEMRSEFGITIECLYFAELMKNRQVTPDQCKKCGKCYAKSEGK